MKYLIITVAGTATRFNRDTKEETLKCLYYTDEPQYALLAQLLKNCGEYDKYILVGGYLYEKLGRFVKNELSGYGKKNRTCLQRAFQRLWLRLQFIQRYRGNKGGR